MKSLTRNGNPLFNYMIRIRSAKWTLVILLMADFLTSCHRSMPLNNLMDSKDLMLTIQEWGFITMPDLETNAQNVVAKEYGFKYEIVGSCIGTDSLESAVSRHNEAVKNILKMRFGNNWDSVFNHRCNAELGKEKRIQSLIESTDSICTKINSYDSTGEYRFYEMIPLENGSKYFVSIQGFMTMNNEEKRVSFYKLLIDYPSCKIQASDNKLEVLKD